MSEVLGVNTTREVKERYCIYCGKIIENRVPRQVSHFECRGGRYVKPEHPRKQAVTHVKGDKGWAITIPTHLGEMIKVLAKDREMTYVAFVEEILLDRIAEDPVMKQVHSHFYQEDPNMVRISERIKAEDEILP